MSVIILIIHMVFVHNQTSEYSIKVPAERRLKQYKGEGIVRSIAPQYKFVV